MTAPTSVAHTTTTTTSTVITAAPARGRTTTTTAGRALRLRAALQARQTPDILLAALGAGWLLVLVLFLVARSGLGDVRAAAQTIGRDAEPSVVAARQIGLSLADMHASVANAFLLGAGQDADAWTTYQQERQTVADTLVTAAQNITYPGEKEQIRALGENVVRYQDLVSQAAATLPQDRAAAMRLFGQADDLLHTQLLPAANELARINNDALEAGYQAHRTSGLGMAILTGLAGLVVLGLLVAIQVFLSRRTRRTFNLPLIGATLLTLVLVSQVAGTLAAASEHLRSAKQDAYDSVYALTSARTTSYDANADESLWLLAQDDPRYESSFQTKARQIADRPPDEATLRAVQQAVDHHQPVPFGGYLANELNNITFPGEREAALGATAAWAQYAAIDGQIRGLERSGDHAGAVALDIGTAQGQSNWAFDTYDRFLTQTITINQQAFESSIQQVFDDLGGTTRIGADTLLPVLALLIAGLIWLGLQPRLAEYR